jgi:O-antigen/teichoic acid export membrane protein
VARGRPTVVAVVALTAAVVNIAGNFALAARYGTSSAAALTLIAYLIWLGGVVATEHRLRRGVLAGDTLPYQTTVSPVAYGE